MIYYYTKTNEINALYNYANLNSQSRCPINLLSLKPILPRKDYLLYYFCTAEGGRTVLLNVKSICATNLVSNKLLAFSPGLNCSFAVALLPFSRLPDKYKSSLNPNS